MRIGIFDSGLGGLVITHSLIQTYPEYDYLYLGDTARVPYGNRSQEAIYRFTREAVAYLCKHDCQLIIIACNTASAEALRRIQQEYLPTHFPTRRVLGVLIPAVEAAVGVSSGSIGVLATHSTVQSGAFIREIHKLRGEMQVTQATAPLLVPLIENDSLHFVFPIIEQYLAPFKHGVDTLILGCTHYPVLKNVVREMLPHVHIVSQDEVVPEKIREYLDHHPEIDQLLDKHGHHLFHVTDVTDTGNTLAQRLFEREISLQNVEI